jgi:hypothetical protein
MAANTLTLSPHTQSFVGPITAAPKPTQTLNQYLVINQIVGNIIGVFSIIVVPLMCSLGVVACCFLP